MSTMLTKSHIPYLFSACLVLFGLGLSPSAQAEYGDVVLNNFSDEAGVKPVIFPHWFHRIRFTCKVCHSDLGIQMKAGLNKITMLSIINGEYCGACHDGKTAWSVENCELCHSGKSKLRTMVDKGSSTLIQSNGK